MAVKISHDGSGELDSKLSSRTCKWRRNGVDVG